MNIYLYTSRYNRCDSTILTFVQKQTDFCKVTVDRTEGKGENELDLSIVGARYRYVRFLHYSITFRGLVLKSRCRVESTN